MPRLTWLILILALLLAACGDDAVLPTGASSTTGAEEPTTPTTAAPTTAPTTPTTAAPTTAPATTTTTTAPATTTTAAVYYLVDTSDFFPDVFPGSNGAHGSGCVTPGFSALPNGVWFGFVEAIAGGNLTFDLACFWTGTPACDAQMDDGFAANPSECLDYYIQNNVTTTFSVPLAADARVWYVNMLSGDVSSPTEIPLASWPSPDSFQDCPSDWCGVWLYVNGGRATAIVEQYRP